MSKVAVVLQFFSICKWWKYYITFFMFNCISFKFTNLAYARRSLFVQKFWQLGDLFKRTLEDQTWHNQMFFKVFDFVMLFVSVWCSENIIFDILLLKSKPITIGVFYRPPNQANVMEWIFKSFSLLDLHDNGIYCLGDFIIDPLQNGNYILNRKSLAACQGPVHTLITTIKNFVKYFLWSN